MNLSEYAHIVIGRDTIGTLGVIRSLGEKAIKPVVILLKEGVCNIATDSRYIGELIYSNSENESVELLDKYKVSGKKGFLYVCDDQHLRVVDLNYDRLKDSFYFFNAGKAGGLIYYMEKKNLCDKALQCGLQCTDNEIVERGGKVKRVSFPIFVKTINPYSDGRKVDVGVFYNQDELDKAWDYFQCDSTFVQNYIDKKGELSMQGISINGGEDIYLPFERMYLRFSKTAFGGYMYYQPFKNEELRAKIEAMIKSIGFSGCFEIEFLVDKNDGLYFLEVNLRFSASNFGVCYGGVNQPYLWALSTLLGRIPKEEIRPLDRRYYVMNELIDIKYAKSVGIFKWMGQFIGCDSYYLLNKHDLKPCLAYWRHRICKKFKSK